MDDHLIVHVAVPDPGTAAGIRQLRFEVDALPWVNEAGALQVVSARGGLNWWAPGQWLRCWTDDDDAGE